MKKLNRVLSFIITVAMVLSMLPTFAMAAVGSTYTYVFSPGVADGTKYVVNGEAAFTWENTTTTTVEDSTPWAYLGGCRLARTYPMTKDWGTGKDKNVFFKDSGNTVYYYAGFRLQLPETGVYSARLDYTAYKLSGSVEVYLLPGDTVLAYDGTDDFSLYSAYELTDDAVSLNTSLFSTTTTKYGQVHSLPNSVTVSSASEVGETGTGRILVIKSAQKPDEISGTDKRSNDYITSLTLTKTADVSVPETDVEYFESEASYGFGVNYSELNSYVSVGTVSAGNVGSAEKGTTLTLKAQKEVEIEGTTYKFVGWKRGGASADESIKDALSFTSYVSHSNEDTFTLWSNTYLTAVYDKIGDAAGQTVEFYNQDGTFLDSATAEYVNTLTTIPTVSLLGHTFEMWQYINKNGEAEEFTPTSELYEAVTRVVAKQNPKTVTITFADGTNGVETVASKAAAAKEYEYGALVNAEEFYDIPTNSTACWYRNELMTRTAAKYAFYAWADMEVRPEFVSSIPTEFRTPKIILDTKTMDGAYMIEYDVYSKNLYEIVEAGILFSNIEDVTLRTFASGEKFTSQNNKIHGQFAAKPSEEWTNVRGYIIYRELENDNLGIVYSDDGAVLN